MTTDEDSSLFKGPAAPADPYDLKRFPFPVRAGSNRYGWAVCPGCKKPPTQQALKLRQCTWGDAPPAKGFFMFRDELSAKEYRISGLCQACQDHLFSNPN